jgi:hypothetical protein
MKIEYINNGTTLSIEFNAAILATVVIGISIMAFKGFDEFTVENFNTVLEVLKLAFELLNLLSM